MEARDEVCVDVDMYDHPQSVFCRVVAMFPSYQYPQKLVISLA